MRKVPTWDQYHLGIAEAVSQRSKDPNTQVGAVIVDPEHRPISWGFNGMPSGFPEMDGTCWHEDHKDDLVVHAEVNAVANAARVGTSTRGATMYLTLPPCLPCARVIAASGLSNVVFPEASYNDWVARKPKWRGLFDRALKYLAQSGVEWKAV